METNVPPVRGHTALLQAGMQPTDVCLRTSIALHATLDLHTKQLRQSAASEAEQVGKHDVSASCRRPRLCINGTRTQLLLFSPRLILFGS